MSNRDFALLVARAYDLERGQHQRPDLILVDTITINLLEQIRVDDIPIVMLTTAQHVESFWEGGHFAVYQRDGLFPSEVLGSLRCIVDVLKARSYLPDGTDHLTPQ